MTSVETDALIEVFQEAMVAQTAAQTGQQQAVMVETFSKIAAILDREDRNWEPIYGASGEVDDGLTLQDLKRWSPKIRESVVGAPWMGQGFRLRHSYVSQNGIRFGNVPKPTRGKVNVQNLIDDTMNQLHFFGKEARRQRELCLYADGIALWLGEDSSKKLEAVPLSQITDQITDPNGLGHVWAYKREWSERNLATGKVDDKKEWYFTDRFFDKRVTYIAEVSADGSGKAQTRTKVSQTHRMFDMHANKMTGMPYGSPDALAAYLWNDIARKGVLDGVAMQKALATFAYKATVKTANAGNTASLKLANPQTAGSTAVVGGANDMAAFQNAGKGYDFSSLVPLVAMIASALSVSVIPLTSNPGDAGSSYSAANTMELPVRLAMEARRDEHVELDKRVLKWMGIEDPEVGYVPFAAGTETYRASQAIILGLQSDLYSRQETRDQLDDLFGRPNGDVPTEDERPSVLLAGALAEIEPEEPVDDDADVNGSVASPNQGRGNGTGGITGASNDVRSDGIGDS